MEHVTREQAEAIAREVMQVEAAPLVFELEAMREQLRQLEEGERVVLPVDTEHAEAMFKVASMYLGFWNPLDDGQFKFK
jgi:uridine kinase